MKTFLTRAMMPATVLLAALALSGCVAYPAGGYGYGYAPGYYPAPAVVVPGPIIVGGGWGGGYGHGGWGHGGWR